jgi:enoyl-CoA hydratase
MSDLSREGIRVDLSEGVAALTLDRPPVNAFTMRMYADLDALVRELGERDEIKCVVLRGEGRRAFSAGFDFKLFAANGAEDDPKRPTILRGMLEAVRTCKIPTIAAINGPALGAGCVLAAACDICVACEEASFSLPEVNFDRVGGSAYVGSRITKGMVRYLAFTGRKMSAPEALRAGLVDFVMPYDELEGFVCDLSRELAAKSGNVLRHTKRALNRIEYLPIDEGYQIEQAHSVAARAGLKDELK